MFGSSPPQFSLPFQSSRRNSLEQSIWAPINSNPERPHDRASADRRVPDRNPSLDASVHTGVPGAPGAGLPTIRPSLYTRGSGSGSGFSSFSGTATAASTGITTASGHGTSGGVYSYDQPELSFAPGIWNDPWRGPDLPHTLPPWDASRRHSVGDVFPSGYLAQAGWLMFGANLLGWPSNAPGNAPGHAQSLHPGHHPGNAPNQPTSHITSHSSLISGPTGANGAPGPTGAPHGLHGLQTPNMPHGLGALNTSPGAFSNYIPRSSVSGPAAAAAPGAASAPISAPAPANASAAASASGPASANAAAPPAATTQSNQSNGPGGALGQVHDYFSLDPHQRVKVTADYLAQRFFDEEKYLGDSYQLPKFPVESSLQDYQLVLVAFKAGRIDVFYLPGTLDQQLSVGDLVMVEADRGRDLGKIVKMNISIDEARLLKLLQFLEQQAALCDTTVHDLLVKLLHGHGAQAHAATSGVAPPTLHFPKPIIGLAQHNEAIQILNKKQDEEKACRLCLAKIASTSNMLDKNALGLLLLSDLMQMKLVDAEYQFDRKKLIFYYSTSRRIDFRDLVRELFRIYKTRIWMCAVNGIPYAPKKRSQSQSQHQQGQTQPSNQQNLNNLNNQGHSQQNPQNQSLNQNHQAHQNHSLARATGGPLALGLRRMSFGSPELKAFAAESSSEVPRKFALPGALEEKDGEGFVLQLLVDTLNH